MKHLILTLSILAVTSIQICGSEERIVTAAADPYPPYVDQTHPKEGLALELIRASLQTQGYLVKMEFVPWARAEAEVKFGHYDILPDVWVTDARKKVFKFSKPYVSSKVKFISLKASPFVFDGLSSLKGKRVGTIRGYGYNDPFLKSGEFIRDEVNDFTVNIKKLIAGRIDLTLEDEIVARMKIVQINPKLLDKIAFSKKALSTNGLHIASGLSNPRCGEIIDAFDKGYEIIRMNGTAAKIFKSYGIDPSF